MIQIKDLTVSLGGHTILEKVNLIVPDGQCVAILGPSGLGKSTLLRTLVGEYVPSTGSVEGLESVGYCQQNSPLFPWLSVLANLELAGPHSAAEIRDLLAQVGLAGIERLRPHEISSGMRRRVTVVRSFLARGAAVLLDEPFTGLDIVTRDKLIELVTALWRQMSKTILYVTHDINEAIRIADRIVVFGPRLHEFMLDVENPLPAPRQVSHMAPELLQTYQSTWSKVEHALKAAHAKTQLI